MSAPLRNILFLDIETVPAHPDFKQLQPEWQELWEKKSVGLLRTREEETTETIYNRAGIYAEFGKVICISCGVISGNNAEKKMVLKSFAGNDEKILLSEFSQMLTKWSEGEPKLLCAHNGKEFDFPYLCRRMIINRLSIPSILNTSGKKPWEVAHLDTMELWKFGDFKNYTSLNLLAHTLEIATPKDDIDGSMVGEVYWSAKNDEQREAALQRIMTYCQKDVLTVAQIFLRMQGEELIQPEQVEIKN